MDGDVLLALVGGIKDEIEGLKSEVGSIYTYVSDITETNKKLDRIIELLEKIENK